MTYFSFNILSILDVACEWSHLCGLARLCNVFSDYPCCSVSQYHPRVSVGCAFHPCVDGCLACLLPLAFTRMATVSIHVWALVLTYILVLLGTYLSGITGTRRLLHLFFEELSTRPLPIPTAM